MPRAVLFDLDDTLIDSTVGYVQTMWCTCDALGLPRPGSEVLHEAFVTWQDHVEAIFPEVPFADFAARYRRFAQEIPYRAIPGALETLELLSDRPLGVVTNRGIDLCGLRMRQAEIPAESFAFIHTLEDLPAAKPDPRALEPALHLLGVEHPAEVIYVGDRPDDARAARAAGVGFVGVLTGNSSPAHFAEVGVGASRILSSVRDLPNFLSDRGGAGEEMNSR